MKRDIREYLAGYVDGELTDEEQREFEAHLGRDPALRDELNDFMRLKKMTAMAHYADLPDEVWENYWHSLYRRTERGVGWILLSLGAIVLLGFGLYQALGTLYADPEAPLWLKLGLTALCGGAIFLLVSYGRERLFASHRERYTEVEK